MSKRAHILQTATRLFATKGYRETSTSELAGLIGAAESTIFYHFKTKEDILLAILRNIREELLGEFERHQQGREFPDGLAMLLDAVSFFFQTAGTRPETFLFLHQRFPYELAAVNAVCSEHLEAIYNCFIEIFENAIRIGQRDGSIGGTSPRKTALILFAMIDGLVRFNTINLYDAGALYDELIASCRRMLQPPGVEA
jgi:AcrR family transcriptional regulator